MIDITLTKAKYRRPARVEHRQNLDPPFAKHAEGGVPCARCTNGTPVYLAGSFKAPSRGNAISNGPIQVKKYRRRANKVRCRMKSYWGNVLR